MACFAQFSIEPYVVVIKIKSLILYSVWLIESTSYCNKLPIHTELQLQNVENPALKSKKKVTQLFAWIFEYVDLVNSEIRFRFRSFPVSLEAFARKIVFMFVCMYVCLFCFVGVFFFVFVLFCFVLVFFLSPWSPAMSWSVCRLRISCMACHGLIIKGFYKSKCSLNRIPFDSITEHVHYAGTLCFILNFSYLDYFHLVENKPKKDK